MGEGSSDNFRWLDGVLGSAVSLRAKVVASFLFLRNGRQGCFPSWTGIGQGCGFSRSTVARAIAALEDRGFLRIIRHHQKPPSYIFSGVSPLTPINPIGVSSDTPETAHRCQSRHPIGVSSDTRNIPREHPNNNPPTPQGGLQGGTASPLRARRIAKPATTQLEALYQAYPRHVARGAAFKAIAKALSKAPYETLLAAVQAYATAQTGHEAQFIPHPATWFNAEHWTDDQRDWVAWKSASAKRIEERIGRCEAAQGKYQT